MIPTASSSLDADVHLNQSLAAKQHGVWTESSPGSQKAWSLRPSLASNLLMKERHKLAYLTGLL